MVADRWFYGVLEILTVGMREQETVPRFMLKAFRFGDMELSDRFTVPFAGQSGDAGTTVIYFGMRPKKNALSFTLVARPAVRSFLRALPEIRKDTAREKDEVTLRAMLSEPGRRIGCAGTCERIYSPPVSCSPPLYLSILA